VTHVPNSTVDIPFWLKLQSQENFLPFSQFRYLTSSPSIPNTQLYFKHETFCLCIPCRCWIRRRQQTFPIRKLIIYLNGICSFGAVPGFPVNVPPLFEMTYANQFMAV
jgi:hypothetical protein